MKVLVCGASGFIGRAICVRLAEAGHEVVRGVRHAVLDGDVAINYSLDLRPEAWLERLHGIDAVVNAVGIIAERPGAGFQVLHADAPAALFAACAESGVRRVVQISALGADTGDTAYFATKRAADEALMTLPLDWVVLRPSLVFGLHGASAALFCRLASLPVSVTPALGDARFQPVHVDDLACAVVMALDAATPARRVVEVVGGRAVSFDGMLAAYRNAMGFAPAPVLHIPAAVMACGAWLGGRFDGAALTPDNWRMLRAGSTPRAAGTMGAVAGLLGRAPRGIESFLTPSDGELLRLRSLAGWRNALLRYVLAIVWLATAVVSAFVYPAADSLALLGRVGLEGPMAVAALYGAVALDAAFGIACIAWPGRVLWLLQAVLILGYSAVIAAQLPEFLWHPFGPILKNVPILAILLILYAEEK